MAVLLGLASALVYGTADFMGGVAAKRTGAIAVVVWSQTAGLALIVGTLVVLGQNPPAPSDLLWGAVGGVGGGTGVALLYRGLARGRMAIVAPTTAVGAAAIPVIVGLLLGERPEPVALIGVALALLAIVLVSSGSSEAEKAVASRRVPEGFPEAVGAGLGFALFFICLAQTDADAGLWPLLTARVSIVVAGLAGLATRAPLRPERGTWAAIAACGVLDMLANLLYLLAINLGLLSLVAVLASLYPASTVVLARVVLRERMTRVQLGGLLAAATGVALIAL